MICKVESNVRLKDKMYKPGQEVDLSEKQIKQLTDKGIKVEKVEKPKGAK